METMKVLYVKLLEPTPIGDQRETQGMHKTTMNHPESSDEAYDSQGTQENLNALWATMIVSSKKGDGQDHSRFFFFFF